MRTQRGTTNQHMSRYNKLVHLILHLSRTQSGGIGFIGGTSVRHPLPHHVFTTIKPSKVLNKPKYGSGAHKPTHMGNHFILKSAQESAYHVHPSPWTMDIIVATSAHFVGDAYLE
jgi:hypothetical protein